MHEMIRKWRDFTGAGRVHALEVPVRFILWLDMDQRARGQEALNSSNCGYDILAFSKSPQDLLGRKSKYLLSQSIMPRTLPEVVRYDYSQIVMALFRA